jgi:cytosine/adenosine deaminase-related metal-dependent hydrolase
LRFNNAKIANLYGETKAGVPAEEYATDIVLMDYWPPTPFDGTTLLGHLGFGLFQLFVDTTICGGKVLMERKKLKIYLDEKEIAAKSLEAARKLRKRF